MYYQLTLVITQLVIAQLFASTSENKHNVQQIDKKNTPLTLYICSEP